MAVLGQSPTRIHLEDSESVSWEQIGAAYPDPNDPTKLVRDVKAHEQELQLYAADTGAANAYVITLSPAPTIVVGTKFVIKAAHSNTAASTLAVNGAAPVAIVKGASTPLAGGEILVNQIFEVTFDGTNYQLAGGATPGGTNHQTQINAAGAFGGVGPGTAGQYLRSGGASADPAYAPIAESEVTGLVTDLATLAAAIINAGLSVAGVTIDGGASPPLTGSKGYVQIPFACTITGWTLLADVSGSAQITVKKCSDAGFPTTASIVASAPPLISGAQKGESSTLTGWTIAITALDILEFNLDSVTTCKRLTLELKLTR